MKVLLFSGGLDSYIASKIINPDIYLYIDIKSKYSGLEIENLKRLDIPHDRLVIDKRLDLSNYELRNSIVPLRNLYFAMIGFSYGDDVNLAATKGDTTKDKDYEFSRILYLLMKHLVTDEKDDKTFSYKKDGMEPVLSLPVKELTKTMLIRKYLGLGFKKEELYKTRSCYGTSKKECGDCKTCFRKAVAYINNDIFDKNLFLKEIDFLKFYNESIKKSRLGEDVETEMALQKIRAI